MDLKGKKIILASNSPRRRELLAGLNIDFTIDTGTDFEEKFSPKTPHSEVPALMSEGKSLHFHRPLSGDEILITSDTMVLCDSLIMGKPHSREEAVAMLRSLSGRSHEVKTAVTMRDCHGYKTVVDTTEVEFKVLSDSEIDYYIDNFKPYDKGGSLRHSGVDRLYRHHRYPRFLLQCYGLPRSRGLSAADGVCEPLTLPRQSAGWQRCIQKK